MYKNSILLLIGTLLLSLSHTAQAETCYYSIKEGTPKITWTGFKYTEKTAVSGTFDTFTFQQGDKATSLAALLETITFSIDTNSTNSGNAARDATLKKTVFGFLKEPHTISGKVVSATEMEMTTELMINQKTNLQMSVESADGKLKTWGYLDLLDNGLKKSYDAVHLACKGLHTGKDGISKTWSTVDIKIEADYEVKCSKGIMDSIKSWFS